MPEIISIPHYPSIMQDRRRYSSLTHADRAYCHASARPQSTLIATTSHWQHLPIRGASQPLPDHVPHVPHIPHYSAFLGSFATHEPEWPIDSAEQMTCATALPLNITPNIDYTEQAEYPESSHCTDLTSSANAPPDYHYRADVPRSLSSSPACDNDGQRLYTMDELLPTSCRSSSKSPPSIKMEQSDGDGCFVMELSAAQVNAISLSQSMAPPAEIPLRATHASEDMRKMMGRFRIDPFAIHNGEHRGVVASWCGGEACPLEEEPLIFEFQLELNGRQDMPKNTSDDVQRSQESNDIGSEFDCDWEGYCREESVFASNASSEWNASEPGDGTSLGSAAVAGFYDQNIQELHESAYLGECTEGAIQTCDTYFGSNPGHEMRMPRAEHQGQFWPRNGAYNTSSRMSFYVADSPRCDNAVLPSISATVSRRWSVSDANLAHGAVQFLMH